MMDRLVIPYFEDTGHDGTWLDTLRFPHSFQVSEYAGRQIADRSGSLAPVSFHHDAGVRQ